MIELILKQGEDKLLTIRITDEKGDPITLASNVHNIQATVMVGNQAQGTYELSPTNGNPLSPIETSQNEPNAFYLKLERAQTRAYPIGILKVTTRVIFIDNNFPNGRSQEFEVLIGKAIAGQTKDLLP